MADPETPQPQFGPDATAAAPSAPAEPEPRLTSLGPDHPDYVPPPEEPDTAETIKAKIAERLDEIAGLLKQL